MEKLTPVTYAFGDMNLIKQTALFYDCVVPFPFEKFQTGKNDLFCTSELVVKSMSEYMSYQVFDRLLHPISAIFKNEHELAKMYGSIIYSFTCFFKMELMDMEDFSQKLYKRENVNVDFLNKPKKVFSKTFNSFEEITKDLNFDDFEEETISRPEEMKRFGFDINYVMPSNKLCSPKATMEDVSIILSGIDLIDTEKASWEQIIDYRQDEKAKNKLRNLRLFLQTNYIGKSRQYIEDDFGKRIDDYNSVVKEYGFNKKKSVISFLANSKNIRTFGTASIASILLGQPIIATGSALTGICLEILNGTLEFITQKHAFSKFKEEHELSYIMDFYDRI